MPKPFWDRKGPILEQYMPKGTTTNNKAYCDLPENQVKLAIGSKHHGLLSSCVHMQKLNKLWICNCLPHPPYSPNLTPCGYHASGPLKEVWMGRSSAQMKRLKRLSEEFFFFYSSNSCIREMMADLHWTYWGLCWKVVRSFLSYLYILF